MIPPNDRASKSLQALIINSMRMVAQYGAEPGKLQGKRMGYGELL
jgi:hypothetical protein